MTTRSASKHRVMAAAAAGALGITAALVALAGPARAAFGGPAFDAYAQGNAVDSTISNPSLPLGLVVEGAGPEASSHLTSYGQSDGEASFPYLGPVVPGLPGILGALYGIPVPSYPLQAQTGSGDKPDDADYPGIALHAESGTSSTVGSATVGNAGAANGTAGGRVDVDQNNNVTATATSAVTGLSIGGIATISGLSSTASVEADGTTGKLTRNSDFTIGQISAPGLSITVPPSTPANVPIPIPIPGIPQLPPTTLPTIPLPFAGMTLPTPDVGFENGSFTVTLPGFGNEMFAIPASAVLSAFQAAGVGLAYQPAVQTPTGIQGATFSFTYTAASLPANMYFSGPTPVTETFGSANASVTLQPAVVFSGGSFPTGGDTFGGTATTPTSAASDSPAATPSKTTSTPKKVVKSLAPTPAKLTTAAAPTAAVIAATSAAALPVTTGGGDSGGGGALGVGGTDTGVVPPVSSDPGAAPVVAPAAGDAGTAGTGGVTGTTAAPLAAAPAAGTAPVAGAQIASSVRPTGKPVNLSDIYLAFVLVAAAALTSMTTLRLLGVRTLWSS